MQFQCTCPQCGGAFADHPQYCSRACLMEGRKAQTPLRVAERFWRRVVKRGPRATDCWEWTGHTLPTGYGQIGIRVAGVGTAALTHRVSWELEHGPIPPGMFVCHRCDNPPCVRPSHLFLGTPAENQRDMVRKGRHVSATRPDWAARGELARTAKLGAADVIAIRELAAAGHLHRAIAVAYGVARGTVSSIVARTTWKHID